MENYIIFFGAELGSDLENSTANPYQKLKVPITEHSKTKKTNWNKFQHPLENRSKPLKANNIHIIRKQNYFPVEETLKFYNPCECQDLDLSLNVYN